MNKLLKLQLGLLILIFSFGAIYAQSDFKSALQDPNSLLPIDPSIRHGQLDNGMKYFIRSNKKPENRIELRLAVNAGSILEDDDQKGLAHFLEHMCFNGTENFEKNELVSYLQSVGVKFGPDLNAYTSFDETVYMIQVPADDEEILKNGLLILEDWAHRVTLDPEEINKERGVVLEEMRMGRGAGQRMLDQYLPVIFKDSKYADRLPIGTKEIIENFGYEEIKRFYDDWYRPDLMAFIAIGDFDAESMEAKVKEIFSRIPMPENPKERKIYEVPDHDETLISIVTDKEATFTNVRLYYKTDPVVYKTVGDFRKSLLHSMYTGMLNQRLEELTKKANPPYLYAGSYFGGTWAKSKDAFQVMSAMQEDGILTALEAITLENERIRRFGFTETELERYKKDIISSYEMAYNERDKTESASYASEYIRHYLSDEPIPGIEFEFAHAKHVVETVRIEEVNALTEGFLGEGNRVVVITSPEKEGLELPTKEEVLDILQKLESTELEAYDDGVADASLMEILPKAGTIKKQKKIAELDVVVLELSNGMKVTLKPTDFKNDQILFSAYAKGGHSVYGDKDYRSASNADRIVPEAGIADFTPTNLQKLLAGQNATVRPYISELYQGFSGSCVPKDLEVLFQLIHLNFTAPREDEELFEAYINRNKAIYRNLMSNPQYYFSDKLSRFLSQDHPRGGGFPVESDWDEIDFARVYDIYRDRFANAAEFNFYFVGNFDVESIKPLLEKYLASLPKQKRKDGWVDLGIRPPAGVQNLDVRKGSDPKSMVRIRFHNEYLYDRKTNYYIQSVAELLSIKLIEILREEKGGVYGVGASAQTYKFPYPNYVFNISFPCGPENVEELKEAAFDEVRKIQRGEITDQDLKKVKEAQLRDMEVRLKENNYWLNVLQSSDQHGFNPADVLEYRKRIEALTKENLSNTAKEYLDFGNYATMVLYPEEIVEEVKE